jgi:integral membrane protein (TIGR04561 family)
MATLLAEIRVFEISISLEIILYVFAGLAFLAFLVYLATLFFSHNKFKSPNLQDEELVKRQILEKSKENVDNEIVSIVKNRKEKKH